jgi:allophanate hydrolase
MHLSLDIANLHRLYRSGELTPMQLVETLLQQLQGEDRHHIWISRLDADTLRAYARTLEGKDIASLPLYGIPSGLCLHARRFRHGGATPDRRRHNPARQNQS